MLVSDSKLNKLVDDLNSEISWTRVRLPPSPPFRKIMFKNWFKKREKSHHPVPDPIVDTQDEIEESLWEIKEEYDLPTEEVVNVVYSKRKNFDYMHEMLSKKQDYE